MASFSSVPDAVSCAMSVQDAFAEHNRETPNDGLLLRIGLHAGEPIEEHGDLFGNAVNLAARLCAVAGPSEILVSEMIRDMSVETAVPFEDRGNVKLKGFETGVRVFSIPWAQRANSG
jgi:class 3 adenylate cyclase